jgi:hypothetical protein
VEKRGERINLLWALRTLLSTPLGPLALWVVVLGAALGLAGPLQLRKLRAQKTTPPAHSAKSQPATSQLHDSDPIIAQAFIAMISASAAATPKPEPKLALDQEIAKAFIAMVSASRAGEPIKSRPALLGRPDVRENASPPAVTATNSINTTFLSIRSDETPTDTSFATIPCRLAGAVSNGADGHHIVINGVVTDNIAASSGKILIEAGTRVVGSGWLDTLAARIKGSGKWSLVTNNHVLKFDASLLEYAGGLDGLRGVETSPEPDAVQRAAVVRDGLYLYVPDRRPFALQIKGGFELSDLEPAREE